MHRIYLCSILIDFIYVKSSKFLKMNQIKIKTKHLFPCMFKLGETFNGVLTEKLDNACIIELNNGAFGKIYTKNYANLPKLEKGEKIEISLIGFAEDGEMIFDFSSAYAKKFGIHYCVKKAGTVTATSRRGVAIYFQEYDDVVFFETGLPPYQPEDKVCGFVYEYTEGLIVLKISEVIKAENNSRMIETSNGEIPEFDQAVFDRAIRIGSAETSGSYKLGYLYKAVIQFNEEDEKVEFADGTLALIAKKEQPAEMGKTAWVRVINIDTKRNILQNYPIEVAVLFEV